MRLGASVFLTGDSADSCYPRRGQWDAKLENARVVETLESPLNAVVEYYKLSGTFREHFVRFLYLFTDNTAQGSWAIPRSNHQAARTGAPFMLCNLA